MSSDQLFGGVGVGVGGWVGGGAVFMSLLGSWRFPTFLFYTGDAMSRNHSVAVL